MISDCEGTTGSSACLLSFTTDYLLLQKEPQRVQKYTHGSLLVNQLIILVWFFLFVFGRSNADLLRIYICWKLLILNNIVLPALWHHVCVKILTLTSSFFHFLNIQWGSIVYNLVWDYIQYLLIWQLFFRNQEHTFLWSKVTSSDILFYQTPKILILTWYKTRNSNKFSYFRSWKHQMFWLSFLFFAETITQ